MVGRKKKSAVEGKHENCRIRKKKVESWEGVNIWMIEGEREGEGENYWRYVDASVHVSLRRVAMLWGSIVGWAISNICKIIVRKDVHVCACM